MLSRNIAYGLAASAWTAALGFAVVPIYLKFLGLEAYGVVGFFATLQALFVLLDMGMAPTVGREVARHEALGDVSGARQLVKVLGRVYWLVAAAIAVCLALAAPVVARHWLNTNHLPADAVQKVVVLLGLVIAARWPTALYQSVLIGAQRFDLSSPVTMATSTLASGGAAIVVSQVSPTLEAFFLWQLFAAAAGTAAMRYTAYRVLGRPRANIAPASPGEFRNALKFSAGMSLITLMAIAFTQVDKLLLSSMLGLADFGRYTLATTICSAIYLVVTPFYNALLPRFTALAATGDLSQLSAEYRASTRRLVAVIAPLCLLIALFGRELILYWTGNPETATGAAPIVFFMALGCALHGIMFVPYALQLAFGQTRLAAVISALLLIAFIPLVVWLAGSHGARGGALAWLLLHVAYVALGTWLTHRRLLPGHARRWLAVDVLAPAALCGCPLIVARLAADATLDSPLLRLAAALVALGASLAIAFALHASCRRMQTPVARAVATSP
jgi:O-antigen/teichoic acid export membrane protein